MDTAATIPTGAAAERWKFSSFCIFSFAISTIIYPIYANWVWGGGWLAALGRTSDSGTATWISPALGRAHDRRRAGTGRREDARPAPRQVRRRRKRQRHSRPQHPDGAARHVHPGVRWFGFNPGSTLAGTDTRIAVVAVNTMLAAAAGAFTAMIYVWRRYGKPDRPCSPTACSPAWSRSPPPAHS